jgi:hypothetical protein
MTCRCWVDEAIRPRHDWGVEFRPIAHDTMPGAPPGEPRMTTVLFVCVENSNRSQMAEAFSRIH